MTGSQPPQSPEQPDASSPSENPTVSDAAEIGIPEPADAGDTLSHQPPAPAFDPKARPGISPELGRTPVGASGRAPVIVPATPKAAKPAQYPGTGEGRVNAPSPIQQKLSRSTISPYVVGGFLGLIVLAGGALALRGCGSSSKSDYQASQPGDKYLSGSSVDKVRTSSRTGLEKIALHGNLFFQVRNKHPQPEETAFVLYPESAVDKVTDEDNKTTVEPNEVVIPTLAKTDKGELITEVDLPSDGPHGVRVPQSPSELLEGVAAKVIQDNAPGYNIDFTAVTIDKTPFYIPRGNPSKKSLPFHLVPREGAKRIIRADGRIALRNSSGMYDPQIFSAKEYAKRAEKQGYNPGAKVTSQRP